MQRLATEATFAALASLALAGCASWSSPPPATTTVARSAAPTRYESTVNNYFDLTMPAQPTPRKISVGAPETSPCALHGTGGRHAGWVVPVIYDTSPPAAHAAAPATAQRGTPSAKGSNDKANDKATKAALAAGTQAVKANASGTPPAATTAAAGSPTMLKEVNVTGTRYFFWFSSETLAAVSRQPDACP
jgi:hypothetical protein